MDADVITIETSRSDMELLRGSAGSPERDRPRRLRHPFAARAGRGRDGAPDAQAAAVVSPVNLWVNPSSRSVSR
jgi:hypothetical protein